MNKIGIGTEIVGRIFESWSSAFTEDVDVIHRETKTLWITKNGLRFYKNRTFPTFPIGKCSGAYYLKDSKTSSTIAP